MGKLTLSEVNKMGDADPKYGQTWWGKANEQTEPVMFNTLDGEFQAGDTIEFEEASIKTSAKSGNTYHRLKKVKKTGSILAGMADVGKPSSAASSDELLALVKENNALLRELAGKPAKEVEVKNDIDSTFEVTDKEMEEPVDMSSIPF